jgi:hypothetical protein
MLAQDVVQRHIYAERPNQRWVVDFMYVATWCGVVCVAFVIGLFKTDVIHRDGPWCGFEDAEMATLEWVAWFNQARWPAPLGSVPPAELEAQYYDALRCTETPTPRRHASNRIRHVKSRDATLPLLQRDHPVERQKVQALRRVAH